jgi:membrane associated rhomboid family serine protease
MAAGRLPLWVWALPVASAVAAVLAWTVWCHTERGTWLGGVLILASGVLVLALVHESLPHGRGFVDWLRRWVLALVAGAAATGAVFLAAGLGYYLRCPPF